MTPGDTRVTSGHFPDNWGQFEIILCYQICLPKLNVKLRFFPSRLSSSEPSKLYCQAQLLSPLVKFITDNLGQFAIITLWYPSDNISIFSWWLGISADSSLVSIDSLFDQDTWGEVYPLLTPKSDQSEARIVMLDQLEARNVSHGTWLLVSDVWRCQWPRDTHTSVQAKGRSGA